MSLGPPPQIIHPIRSRFLFSSVLSVCTCVSVIQREKYETNKIKEIKAVAKTAYAPIQELILEILLVNLELRRDGIPQRETFWSNKETEWEKSAHP